ncbi:agmatine deiminase family protein [Parahaliea aestuarii]|uniref:Agmatine deiminase family protein n=1 Tax=Parahaliea aestuarii TaxID=1852021 RepID=A0A5C9A3N7_9GAMM|nr:agmatine deiminase family protein [Parahaliea aestuarii]TXS94679.1 agmatine deiminase family protein [Parahaliea aestuarii]
MTVRLPAEWEAQDAIQLTWPHADSDWLYLLPEVETLYTELVQRISTAARVLIAAPAARAAALQQQFDASLPGRVRCYAATSNDTWARDHGPITISTEQGLRLLDFRFNGWGGKFEAAQDNALTAELKRLGAFPNATLQAVDMVLEGGAIESDGRGTLLTTAACLLNRNRNPDLDRGAIERALGELLGVRKINWLQHGALAGDDTDSHIDTLARLCPDNTLLYQACDDPQDEHFADLAAMARELAALTDATGSPYRLLPLPWPGAQHDPEDGHRLPATYANFLICNGLVLVPTYADPNDDIALAQVAEAFPGYRVEGLDCRTLIRQHGSLHCITMQLPAGVLQDEQAADGGPQA